MYIILQIYRIRTIIESKLKKLSWILTRSPLVISVQLLRLFYLGLLLPLSLSYCIRNRLISDVTSASSLIRKVTQPELGNMWCGNAFPSLTNALRMLIGKGRSANLPPCIWPISFPLMRNSVPPNLWDCELTPGQLINSVLTLSNTLL